jgi:uncharacterized protein
VIVDTSALLAFLDRNEPMHRATATAIAADDGPFVISPMALEESDYLIATRHGVDAELAMLDEITSGAWEIAAWTAADTAEARAVIAHYRDQQIGLTDAANVVLAARYGTHVMATLDRRRFTVLRALDARPFDIVP